MRHTGDQKGPIGVSPTGARLLRGNGRGCGCRSLLRSRWCLASPDQHFARFVAGELSQEEFFSDLVQKGILHAEGPLEHTVRDPPVVLQLPHDRPEYYLETGLAICVWLRRHRLTGPDERFIVVINGNLFDLNQFKLHVFERRLIQIALPAKLMSKFNAYHPCVLTGRGLPPGREPRVTTLCDYMPPSGESVPPSR